MSNNNENHSKQNADSGVSALMNRISNTFNNEKISAIINVTNVMADAIFIVNAQGVFESVNPIAAKYFNVPADSLIGKKWQYFLQEQYRDDYEYMFNSWNNNYQTPLNHGPKEVKVIKANGNFLDVELSISCLPTAITGNTPLFICIMHDISKHVKKYKELEALAKLDHLTGVANRCTLEKTMIKNWQECLTNKQPLSFILIDIDFFKQFNDSFGHVKGDKCLQIVARTIENCLPSNECLVARYGGEEFAVVLPRAHISNAEMIAKRIQEKILNINFRDIGLPANVKISVSQGLACEYGVQYRTSEALICAADTALYRAKSEGRNKLCII
ncbi:GGDEF domain-containing protein [Pseudoalteromonas sp. SG45-5]|uniref:sensor domain-containing diguanylate cyclase n=1 Tax=unclassified Pseudoalteromonas TaxID=194690 RepID=UPI0015FE5BE7|nr:MULTISPECIES: sensor domain-containing diguanylate cyclase [unclassified Pseudoalteromonas]MBB1384460.1 GGDEF domain-containing protein [Pseudoalteromonas sp. SG45-5]MBB1395464.1 GGDEF domain-containing protein [Pseudoalteromonas sp. SG44-4]MBB1448519.1 GGDEF domain-containing protein [Pseudoalteromonas sp. SG41-6]